MKKCDFCPDSVLINGKLVCPFDEVCMLTKSEIAKILDKLKPLDEATENE